MMFNQSEVFWAYHSNGRYILSHFKYGNCVFSVDGTSLPEIEKYYKEDLDELGIHYELCDNELLIYDPEVVEWEEVTAPILKVCGSQASSRTFGTYTGKIPSSNMFEAAQNYRQEARKKIYDLRFAIEKKEFESSFTTKSKDGISIWWTDDDINFFHSSDIDTSKYFLFNLAHHNSCYSFEGLVILKSALKGKHYITLEVPEWHVGIVIGKGGANIKKLTQELGLRHITVKAFDED